MFGKAFESQYDGSMYGAGLNVFAVWGYVIAKTRDSIIELNPHKLSDTLGGTLQEIESAIEYLSRPDPESHNQEHGGARLVRQNGFSYLVPSWDLYRAQKTAADRKAYLAMKQSEYRERMKAQEAARNGEKPANPKGRRRKKIVATGSGPSPGEVAAVQAMERGDEKTADAIAAMNSGMKHFEENP